PFSALATIENFRKFKYLDSFLHGNDAEGFQMQGGHSCSPKNPALATVGKNAHQKIPPLQRWARMLTPRPDGSI
ncbi:TPA: hypothetical protein ACTC15_001696, partial [Neisseria meningitidis]